MKELKLSQMKCWNKIDYNIPEWYIDSIKKLVYLFPKAYAVESGILNLILLWYKEKYPKEFEDVTGQPEIVL